MTFGKRGARAALVAATSALMLAACGGQSSGAGPTGSPSPSPSGTPTATPAPSASPVVLAQVVGSMGTILVAASNGHTVYTFKSDTPGVTNCKGGCISAWPPLSLPYGSTPMGGTGVTGQVGTVTRADGSLQVKNKGLPIYFVTSVTKLRERNG